jgi:hypothetical protein
MGPPFTNKSVADAWQVNLEMKEYLEGQIRIAD